MPAKKGAGWVKSDKEKERKGEKKVVGEEWVSETDNSCGSVCSLIER